MNLLIDIFFKIIGNTYLLKKERHHVILMSFLWDIMGFIQCFQPFLKFFIHLRLYTLDTFLYRVCFILIFDLIRDGVLQHFFKMRKRLFLTGRQFIQRCLVFFLLTCLLDGFTFFKTSCFIGF
jgi:hypothetical protein